MNLSTMDGRQERCLEIGFKYWRAPDAHGVTCTPEQAVEFLQDCLGVEVEIKPPNPIPCWDDDPVIGPLIRETYSPE